MIRSVDEFDAEIIAVTVVNNEVRHVGSRSVFAQPDRRMSATLDGRCEFDEYLCNSRLIRLYRPS